MKKWIHSDDLFTSVIWVEFISNPKDTISNQDLLESQLILWPKENPNSSRIRKILVISSLFLTSTLKGF